mmetsp:Transcript_18742/g.26884  ORF Transcript_18742/g.26884 Transcript_18742/m.26884 type:complete len:341 (-) Transcript_18742:652-1674(-)
MMMFLSLVHQHAAVFSTPAKRLFQKSKIFMMPEGPEVYSIVDKISTTLKLSEIPKSNPWFLSNISVISGRYSDKALPKLSEFINVLPVRLDSVQCKGKFIYFQLANSSSIWSTLGLSGGWMFSSFQMAHSRICLTFVQERNDTETTTEYLHFYDQRNFGTMKLCFDPKLLDEKIDSLGDCWLSGPISYEKFRNMIKSNRMLTKPLVVFLMNQKKTAGIGNYLVSEILYKCKWYPFVTCGELDDVDLEILYKNILSLIIQSYLSQTDQNSRHLYLNKLDLNIITSEMLSEIQRPFEFCVYMQRFCPQGFLIQRDDGPHKRTIHWVPQLQSKYAPTQSSEPY